MTTIDDKPPTAQVIAGLPKRPRGRPSAAAELDYREQVAFLCALIRQIQSTMDFAVGSRGWCYILERHGLRKGDFDDAQKLVNDCRKSGELPLDICAEDESRATSGEGQLGSPNIQDEVESWITHLRDHAHESYTPISYVQDYIRQFGVRKCEANALVVEPEIGRQLVRDAILQHLPADALERYQRKLERARKRLRRALRQRVT